MKALKKKKMWMKRVATRRYNRLRNPTYIPLQHDKNILKFEKVEILVKGGKKFFVKNLYNITEEIDHHTKKIFLNFSGEYYGYLVTPSKRRVYYNRWLKRMVREDDPSYYSKGPWRLRQNKIVTVTYFINTNGQGIKISNSNHWIYPFPLDSPVAQLLDTLKELEILARK